jgi:hypothetical protein
MKKLVLSHFFLAFLLSLVAHAQISTVTTETVSSYSSGDLVGIRTNAAVTQTFSTVVAVNSMTYRFAANNTFINAGASSALTLTAYFTEWNTTTNKPIGGSLYSTSFTMRGNNFGSTGLDSSGEPYNYFDYQINPGAQATGLNPLSTYAMILVNSGTGVASSGVSMLQINQLDPDVPSTNAFAYGGAFTRSLTAGQATGLPMSYASLTSTYASTALTNADFGFSQISVSVESLSPVPEPATAAAVFAGAFVAFMVGYRIWQRKKSPVAVELATQ